MGMDFKQLDFWSVLSKPDQIGFVVYEGRMYRIMRRWASVGEPTYALMLMYRYGVESAGLVHKVLHQGVTIALSDAGERPPEPLKPKLEFHDRLWFVTKRLIPYLRTLNDQVKQDRTSEIGSLTPSNGLQVQVSEYDLAARLSNLLLGENMIVLKQPVFGAFNCAHDLKSKPCFVHADGEIISLQDVPEKSLDALNASFQIALAQYMKEKVLNKQAKVVTAETDRAMAVVEKNRLIYCDSERHVMVYPKGPVVCVQRVPPYVIEASDGSFRKFDEAWIWMFIRSLIPEEVVVAENLKVFSSYEHLFTNDGHLCTGMGSAYDQMMPYWNMPLEEAIVDYLNLGRLTLCAGYYEGATGTPYNRGAIYQRPQIHLEVAEAEGLPVYRYFREQSA